MPRRKKSLAPTGGAWHGKIQKRTAIQLLILGLSLYVVAAGLVGIGRSFHAMRSATPSLLVVAVVLVGLSYVAAAATYTLLSPRRIGFGPTLLVQASGGLVNRLLPGGLGGLGVNALYLQKRGATITTATAVVATNNMLGFIGNALLIVATLLVFPPIAHSIKLPAVNWWAIAAVAAIVILLLWLAATRKRPGIKLKNALTEAGRYAAGLMRHPLTSGLALLSSCSLTALHASALFVVLLALHASVTWPTALLAVSAGSLLGAAVPTPGGLGGAEAGIAAALIASGVPSSTAVAAGLVYRGISYWLPLLPGYVALRVVERRYL